MGNTECVLVDTNILLVDPDVLVRIRQNGGFPFLTSTVLEELDFNKDGRKRANQATTEADVQRAAENARNARLLLREFSATSTRPTELPTGKPLLQGDALSRVEFKGGPVFLIGREAFRSRRNDEKIVELAKDYEMFLITRDNGMIVNANLAGVKVERWTGPKASGQRRAPREGPRNAPRPFAVCISPVGKDETLLPVGKIPAAGDTVRLSGGQEFRLGALIRAGGEGSIYETLLAGQVCKIYHRDKLTLLKKRKIEMMVSRRIERAGICWPTEVVTDETGEFVGYLMPRAAGTTIQKAMFVKPVLEKTFPNWRRRDLANVALTFIQHIRFLHSLNIVVGDINPQNLLVTADSTQLWMVDTDSFQIEHFPCPVGTVNFTPPEIQGQSYSAFLRTMDHELFAVATMVFMILLPGKPPYSQQGGGTPADNIKSRNFPYPFTREAEKGVRQAAPTGAPPGPWQYIWHNLPHKLREAFSSTFRDGMRTTVEEWATLLRYYRNDLDRGYHSNELFPKQFRIHNPVAVICAECSRPFTESQQFVTKLQTEGKRVWCPDCRSEIGTKRRAAQSRNATPQVIRQPTTFGRSTSTSVPPLPSLSQITSQIASRQRPVPPVIRQSPAPSHRASPPTRSSGSRGGLLAAIWRLFK